jgi:hypothetical protein
MSGLADADVLTVSLGGAKKLPWMADFLAERRV